MPRYLLLSLLLLAACGGAPEEGHTHGSSSTTAGSGGAGGAGGGSTTAVTGTATSGGDGGAGTGTPCSVDGNPGVCIDDSMCAMMADHTATPGYCPGPANIQCCTPTPNVADNPPIPAGYKPMMQSEVTPEMTDWAVSILDDPTDYPMFSTAMMTFGTLMVLARVEWHPPDFNNSKVHRGVTLYEPA